MQLDTCYLRKWNCLCFAEFCREVTDTQMPQVAPVILPEMYKIFTQAEVILLQCITFFIL